MPAIETELASLGRQQQALEKVYYGYQDKLKTLEAAKEGPKFSCPGNYARHCLPEPVSPKPSVNALFGALVGLLLGIASMQFAEAKRQPIRSLGQLNGLSMSPVYRIVPELREPFRGLENAPPEQFESLLLNYLRSQKRPYRMAVVGISKDSGASIASLNLAISGARHGSKVLHVQCDPKGALARLGHKNPQAGQEISVAHNIKATCATSVLDVSDQRSGIAWSITSKESDLTVIDLEPTTRSAEYAFLAPFMDEVILLVRAGRSRSVEFLQAQQALRDAGCPRVTVVFTRSSDFSVVIDAIDPHADQAVDAAVPAWLLPTKAAPGEPAQSMAAKVLEVPVQTETPARAEEPTTWQN